MAEVWRIAQIVSNERRRFRRLLPLAGALLGLTGCSGVSHHAPSSPPPPPVSNSNSPAALAPSLNTAEDLRIGSKPDPPPAPPPAPLFAGPARPVSRPLPSPSGVVQAGGSGVTTYEQAQAILAARGVKWQRLETWGDSGEWKFTCSIPNRQNEFISRTYEGRADNYLAAVQAVLEQIQNER